MPNARVSVEWILGDIFRYFSLADFKKNLKVSFSAIGKMYVISAPLQNCDTCIHGNLTSRFFAIKPPSLQEYYVALGDGDGIIKKRSFY